MALRNAVGMLRNQSIAVVRNLVRFYEGYENVMHEQSHRFRDIFLLFGLTAASKEGKGF